MLPLNNYILERLNPKHLGHTAGKFPVEGTIDEMADFLRKNWFEEVKDKEHSLPDTVEFFNNLNGKCFAILRDRNDTLEFTNTSKNEISVDNPLYLLNLWPDKQSNVYRKLVNENGDEVFLDIKTFEKEMEKYFK